MLPATFFAAIKGNPVLGFPKRLSQKQVDSFNAIAEAFLIHGDKNKRHLAYILATWRGEVGTKMQPVIETFAPNVDVAIRRLEKAWATGKLPSVSKPYWRKDADGKSWLGRGGPQLTHKANYEKAGKQIGVDLVAHPELMLNIVVSAQVSVACMINGDFTGVRLGDNVGYRAMRSVVNGVDRAKEFADYAEEFERALSDFDFNAVPVVEPTTEEGKKMDASKLVGWVIRMLLMNGGTAGAVGTITEADWKTFVSVLLILIGAAWSFATKVKEG